MVLAREMALSCSASEDETPDIRTGSMSIGSHRLLMISQSAVVASDRVSLVLVRLDLRARRTGFTSFRVRYIPEILRSCSSRRISSAAFSWEL